LIYVYNQTIEICLTAVKQDRNSLRFVDKSIFSEKRIIVLNGNEIEISEALYHSLKKQGKEDKM